MDADIVDLEKALDAVQAMKDMRDITDDYGPGDSFPYNGLFGFYEQYAIFAQETALSIGLACMMVFIILVILLADFITSAKVLIMVGMIDVNIMGMFYFWGVTLNAITIIVIVVSIGLAVDYNAHIAHAFKHATGTRNERVIKAFDTLGVSVFHGAVSTFLAIFILAFSRGYIFLTFFKSFFGIVVFGLGHGLVLLPVILSWLGVGSVGSDEDDDLQKKPTQINDKEKTPNGADHELE
jgi:multidrug efflux pump subunit AcrB